MWPDFVKLKIDGARHEILRQKLDFTYSVCDATGVVDESRLTAFHHCCKIQIIKARAGAVDDHHVMFEGSVHKMVNSINGVSAPVTSGNGFNGNLFSNDMLIQVNRHLESLFEVSLQEMILQNLEIGANVIVPFQPQLFIKGLLFHHGKRFQFEYDHHSAQVIHQRYYLKIYDKAFQYGLNENVLRTELKYKKMTDLNLLGVRSMKDLTSSNFEKFKNLLISKLNDVVYYDYTLVRDVETEGYFKYSNPNYWLEELQPNHRDRHKRILRDAIANRSQQLLKQILVSIDTTCVISNQMINTERVIINTSIIMLENTHRRFCYVTGLDISMQKEESNLLSHTGLRYYYEHFPHAFYDLRKKYLSEKWTYASFDVQIVEMGHNIRNTISNRRIKQRKIYTPNQPTLF